MLKQFILLAVQRYDGDRIGIGDVQWRCSFDGNYTTAHSTVSVWLDGEAATDEMKKEFGFFARDQREFGKVSLRIALEEIENSRAGWIQAGRKGRPRHRRFGGICCAQCAEASLLREPRKVRQLPFCHPLGGQRRIAAVKTENDNLRSALHWALEQGHFEQAAQLGYFDPLFRKRARTPAPSDQFMNRRICHRGFLHERGYPFPLSFP